MTLLIIGTGCIVVVVIGLVIVATADREFHRWDDSVVKQKKREWK